VRTSPASVLPILLAMVAIGCGGSVTGPRGAPDVAVPSAPIETAAPIASSVASAPELDPPDLPADTLAAIEWRRATGLRADPAWIAQVAADPGASESWAFPITQAEEQFIWDRQARLDDYVGPIQGYATRHSDEFGGLYIDNATSRIATMWTAHLAEHQAALLELLGDGAPVEVLPARWTEARLRQLQDSIVIDSQWFLELAARGEGFGVDIERNLVTIDISSASPDAPRRIAERIAAAHGVPVEMIEVTSDGTGVELLANGTVTGVVTLADGSKPGENELRVDGVPDGIGYCGGGDMAFGVARSGRFEIGCKVGSFTMVVLAQTGEGHERIVGRAHANVRAGETTRVHITLEPGAPVRG
jgi:hypothetical protein